MTEAEVIKKLRDWAECWGGEKPVSTFGKPSEGDIGWWHAAKEVKQILDEAMK